MVNVRAMCAKENDNRLPQGALAILSLSRLSDVDFLALSMSLAQKKLKELDRGPGFEEW